MTIMAQTHKKHSMFKDQHYNISKVDKSLLHRYNEWMSDPNICIVEIAIFIYDHYVKTHKKMTMFEECNRQHKLSEADDSLLQAPTWWIRQGFQGWMARRAHPPLVALDLQPATQPPTTNGLSLIFINYEPEKKRRKAEINPLRVIQLYWVEVDYLETSMSLNF